MPPRDVTAATYRFDRLRAVATGVIESAQTTFLLLLAVRVFAADPTSKALVASGNSLGLLLSLVLVWLVTARGWLPARAAAGLALIGAGCFALVGLWPSLPVFVVGAVVGMASLNMGVPLLTQIYQDNYPANARGRLFSRAVMIRIGFAAGFSALAGWALSRHLGWYRPLLWLYAGAFLFAAWCLSRFPSQPLRPQTGTRGASPWRALIYCREDRLFRWTLIAWMVMGFANLMMLPLRVEYLANPRYGLNLTATAIAMLTGVIPNLARLALSPVWGRLFDRMNFFAMRVVLNLGFALGILTFFLSDSLPGLLAGAVIFGVSNAGGEVAWNLWVTKVAPPDRVADYMSVHTFFTGLRGLVAPLVAFHLIGRLSLVELGGLCAALIVVSCLILVREIKLGKAPDPGTTVVEKSTGEQT